jgi:hypothetical protein
MARKWTGSSVIPTVARRRAKTLGERGGRGYTVPFRQQKRARKVDGGLLQKVPGGAIGPQETLDASAQRRVARAGFAEERVALAGGALQCGGKHVVDALPRLGAG